MDANCGPNQQSPGWPPPAVRHSMAWTPSPPSLTATADYTGLAGPSSSTSAPGSPARRSSGHTGRGGDHMTEAQWLACTDVRKMFSVLRRKANGRQVQLFAAACCRRIWHHLTDDRCRNALEAAECSIAGIAWGRGRARADHPG